MADTLKDFLIALKFNIDADGLRRFSESIDRSHRFVRDFAIGVAGMATAVEEAVRRTTRQFENLFYLSQQGNVAVANVSAWQFAFKQVGLSADDLNQTILSVAKNLRDNPGLYGLAQGLVPGAKDATEIVQGLAQQYRTLMDRFGESGPQLDAASIGIRIMGERLGISAETLYRLARNWNALQQGLRDQRSIVAAFGLDQKRAADQAVEAERSWNIVWESLKIALDTLIVESFPILKGLLDDFAAWFKKEGAASIREWARSIRDFVRDKKNIEDIEHRFKQVGGAIRAVARGISSLIDDISALNKQLGATGTLLTVIFGVFLAKAAATALVGGIARLFGFAGAGLGAAAGGLGGVVAGAGAGAAGTGGILGVLGGLFAGGSAATAAGMFVPDAMLTPEQQKARRGAVGTAGGALNSALHWLGRQMGYEDEQGRPIGGGKPADTGPTPTPIPGARKSAFTTGEGGGLDLTEMLLRGFTQWWQGDATFRPFVSLTEDTFDKIRNILSGEGGLADAVGSAVGDHVGVAGGGRMPGRVRPGGDGGGGGSINVPNIEGMTPAERNFLGLAEKYESHGRNIMNFIGDRRHTAQGFFQITNTNWHRLAPRLGITAPNAMAASLEDQAKVALALLRESGPGNWTNFNAQLRAAVGRGEKAVFDIPNSPLGKAAAKWAETDPNKLEFFKYNREHRDHMMNWNEWNKRNLGVGGARTSMNVDSDHNTNINIYGASNPQGTGEAVRDVQSRASALHTRNLRTALA